MSIKQDLIDIFDDIKNTNNYILKITKKLNTILYNLKIESNRALLKEVFNPIVEEFQKTIHNMDIEIIKLIDTNRQKAQDLINSDEYNNIYDELYEIYKDISNSNNAILDFIQELNKISISLKVQAAYSHSRGIDNIIHDLKIIDEIRIEIRQLSDKDLSKLNKILEILKSTNAFDKDRA